MKDQPPISDLLKNLRDETTLLIRQEVQLAKTEAAEKVSTLVRNLVYILAGALVGYSALHFLLLAVTAILAHMFWGMEMAWAISFALGALIVAVVVGVVAGAFIGKAKSAFNNFTMAPERTIDSINADKKLVERKLSHGRP